MSAREPGQAGMNGSATQRSRSTVPWRPYGRTTSTRKAARPRSTTAASMPFCFARGRMAGRYATLPTQSARLDAPTAVNDCCVPDCSRHSSRGGLVLRRSAYGIVPGGMWQAWGGHLTCWAVALLAQLTAWMAGYSAVASRSALGFKSPKGLQHLRQRRIQFGSL